MMNGMAYVANMESASSYFELSIATSYMYPCWTPDDCTMRPPDDIRSHPALRDAQSAGQWRMPHNRMHTARRLRGYQAQRWGAGA